MKPVRKLCHAEVQRRTRASELLTTLLVTLATCPVIPAQQGSITLQQTKFLLSRSDAAGNVYGVGSVLGDTPTAGAAQTQFGGGSCPSIGVPFGGPVDLPCPDAFIVKQDASGKTIFATYLGGPTADGAQALAVNAAGEVYVVGTTGGSFPT
ncbi:MAG TPA: hypothetical protein VKE70_25820, partial [Candidatus Solibacter sp.]|nr:hypothetical protein [Candidatus Solibacter sp.]